MQSTPMFVRSTIRFATIAVVFVGSLASECVIPRASIGQKIDNYLNRNMPYLVFSADSQVGAYRENEPYHQDPWCNCAHGAWQEDSATIGFEVAWYDQLSAEQQTQVDANNSFASLFGWVGGAVSGYAFGAPAASLASNAAGALGAGAAGQWLSGAFGSALTSIPGSLAGSW